MSNLHSFSPFLHIKKKSNSSFKSSVYLDFSECLIHLFVWDKRNDLCMTIEIHIQFLFRNFTNLGRKMLMLCNRNYWFSGKINQGMFKAKVGCSGISPLTYRFLTSDQMTTVTNRMLNSDLVTWENSYRCCRFGSIPWFNFWTRFDFIFVYFEQFKWICFRFACS